MKICPTCSSEHPDEIQFCPQDGATLQPQGGGRGGGNLVGTVIADRYRIEKKLGEGGMGTVYLGEHVRMRRKSAIKVMTQAMANDPEAIQRFNREAANAARINHPNVCAIYDFGETDDGTIYLAMEFIEGEALSETIQREGTLHPERGASILRQAAEALAVAHDMGIIHRDLKPDNIMIARARDGSDLVKVVDFGIAKAMGPEEGQNVTKTGLVVGTPEYMSPEQLSGDTLDGRSDLYSLALVFFRTLTGKLPFEADTAQETMIKRLTDEPERLNDALPGANFPPRLQEVMDRALARMPRDRYANTAAFATDVTEALEGTDTTQVVAAQGQATELIAAARPADAPEPTVPVPETRVSQAARTPTPDTPQPRATAPVEQVERPRKPTRLVAAGIAVVVLGTGAVAVAIGTRGDGGTPVRLDTAQLATKGVSDNTGRDVLSREELKQDDSPGADNVGGRSDRRPAVDSASRKPGSERTDTAKAAPLDTESISGELDTLFARIEESASPAVLAGTRAAARRYWDRQDLPVNLRGYAARIIGWTYQQQDSTRAACEWYGQALRLQPENKTNQQFVTMMECN